ncbi:hypothetical protein [Xylophilus sp. ASV27]|nr:hypothetical protein [Xylophilus sp. ASV27]
MSTFTDQLYRQWLRSHLDERERWMADARAAAARWRAMAAKPATEA